MAFLGVARRGCRYRCALLLIAIFSVFKSVTNHQQQQVAEVAIQGPKILIPDLPLNHYRFWLKNHPLATKTFEEVCSKALPLLDFKNVDEFKLLHANLTFDDERYLEDINYGKSILKEICSKIGELRKSCWGYENNCRDIYLMPECHGKSTGHSRDEQEMKVTWFGQADFGYILNRRKEISKFCSPDRYSNDSLKSSLECSSGFKTCRGQDLYMRFRDIPKQRSSLIGPKEHYLIKNGDIGGWNCDLQLKRIKEEGDQRGTLRSWFTELEHYNKIENPNLAQMCDITIEKQVFVMKLDSPSNMYHYFCNFLNLYATIHMNNKFSVDNEIIIWDNQVPRSKFDKIWSVFSKNPPKSIGQFSGKQVCFKKFIFTMLPRMTGGLYYNTPLITDCYKSGLFDAFNKHVIHKLRISQNYTSEIHQNTRNEHVRITIIRRITPHRRILNELELEQALRNRSSSYSVRLVAYDEFQFMQQLDITQNTDLLIGIHGAGLTHTLFLPDWAALFELNDCGDKCYHDLSRLRGVNYFAMQDNGKSLTKIPVNDSIEHERLKKAKLDGNEKFSNYQVDVDEFISTAERAIEQVKKNRIKQFGELGKFETLQVGAEKLKTEGSESTKPKVVEPETKKPKAEESEAAKAEIVRPRVKGFGVTKPEVKESGATKFDVKQSTKHNVEESESTKPDLKELKVGEPEDTKPKAKGSKAAKVEVVQPKVRESEVTGSEVKEKATKIEVQQSIVKEPEVEESESTKHEVKEFEIGEPVTSKPEVRVPENKEPEVKESIFKKPKVREPETRKLGSRLFRKAKPRTEL